MKNKFEKLLDRPKTPHWDDYGNMLGRFIGWSCCLLLIVFVFLVGPFYVVFGEEFDKQLSGWLLKFEEFIGIRF
jgi:hypothetical protein